MDTMIVIGNYENYYCFDGLVEISFINPPNVTVNGMRMKGSRWSWWSPDNPLNEESENPIQEGEAPANTHNIQNNQKIKHRQPHHAGRL
ncbi:hypothetical protein Smar_1369 [Staphylothermus marinus F1]|uniref:Uncharacterized protein n=1 Tax=Staphylothermus marinus (strain ATCC 43588 / DSM 3639 / JCM 9404 / F1) TaxID=399550 RepID=A3DPA0_STAMF|nr:hypothetical protein Smar_1369 [Staphylothermus marinus F1]